MLCWCVALLVRYSAGPSTGLVAVSTSVHFLIRAIRSAACFAPRHPSPLPRPGICHCHHPMLPSLIALLMRVPLLVRLLVRPPSCPTPPPLRTGSVTLRPSHYVRSRPPHAAMPDSARPACCSAGAFLFWCMSTPCHGSIGRNHPAATTPAPHPWETGQVVPGGDGPNLSNPGPRPLTVFHA